MASNSAAIALASTARGVKEHATAEKTSAARATNKQEETEIATLFNSLAPSTDDAYETITRQVADEFTGGNAKQQSRRTERASILKKIKKLKHRVHRNRNVANHRRRLLNDQRAHKRSELKLRIRNLENQLQDINLEETAAD